MMATWLEWLLAALVLTAATLALIGAIGLLRLPSFLQRLHAPALGSTLATWCAALATVVYFTSQGEGLHLMGALVPLMLAITTPVTTQLLARTALFRSHSNKPG